VPPRRTSLRRLAQTAASRFARCVPRRSRPRHAGVKAVEEGRLSATFTCPTNGKEAIDAAKKILIDCGTVEKEQILSTQEITPKNAAKVYAEANAG
jgi:hypothetical protein